MAKHFAEPFIKKEVSRKLHNEILDHLVDCKECFQYYIRVAEKLKRSIEFENGSAKLIVDPKNKTIKEIESSGVHKGEMENPYQNWTEACKLTDLSVLMQVKAVRDSVHEVYDVEEGESEIFRDFGLFIIKKICQKVDHLENCLKLEEAKRN